VSDFNFFEISSLSLRRRAQCAPNTYFSYVYISKGAYYGGRFYLQTRFAMFHSVNILNYETNENFKLEKASQWLYAKKLALKTE